MSKENVPLMVQRLLAKVKQETGGDAWDGIHTLCIQSTVHQGGLTGSLEQWQDCRTGRYSQHFDLGITSGGEGFDGNLPWSQDAGKQVRWEENEDAQRAAVNNAYRVCLASLYPQRWAASLDDVGREETSEFFVFRVTPEGGRPFDLWINTEASLIDRIVEKEAFQTLTTSFSDYSPVDGVKIPFSVHLSNGDARFDQTRTVHTVEVNPPVLDDCFQMPPLPPDDFSIKGSVSSTMIPFRLIGNLVLVEVSINGKESLPFVLDTGGVNIVTPEAAEQLGLKSEGVFWGLGGGVQSVAMGATKVVSLDFGDIHLSDQVFLVYPFPGLKDALGISVLGGLLGYEVFKRFVVHIDYRRQNLTFALPCQFTYEGSGLAVPFKFHSNIPEVEGAINAIPGKFDLDTGNTGALILNSPFVEEHSLRAKYEVGAEMTTRGQGGGPTQLAFAQADVLRLGAVEVHGLPIALSFQQTGALSNPYAAGLVGAEVFKQFSMIFDYSRQQVIFEKLEA